MADYTYSKKAPGAVFPENAIETSFSHNEPLLTPEQLRGRFLFGISMASNTKDPVTGKAQVMTDDLIADIIIGAVASAEEDAGIDIFPVKRREKHPFDIQLYNSFGHLQLEHKPATSLDKLSVTPSNDLDVYVVPNEWVEGAYLLKGQINIVPLTVAFVQGTYVPTQSAGGAAYLQILGNKSWIPAWWQVEYTSGFPDGMIPRAVNDLIGTFAAIEVLSQLAATFGKSTSQSLGIDGLSQSVSTPGPSIYDKRIEILAAKQKMLRKKIKARYGNSIFAGTL